MPGLQRSRTSFQLTSNYKCHLCGPELLHSYTIQQLLKLQPFIFAGAHYLSEKGLPANLAKIKGPLTLWDLQYYNLYEVGRGEGRGGGGGVGSPLRGSVHYAVVELPRVTCLVLCTEWAPLINSAKPVGRVCG